MRERVEKEMFEAGNRNKAVHLLSFRIRLLREREKEREREREREVFELVKLDIDVIYTFALLSNQFVPFGHRQTKAQTQAQTKTEREKEMGKLSWCLY